MSARSPIGRRLARLMLTGFTAIISLASPAVPAEVTIKDMVEITDIDSLSVSPDGRFAVFRSEQGDLGRNTYILRWHSIDVATGSVKDIGSGGDPIYTDPGLLNSEKVLWTADGRTIVVRSLVDGAVGLWRADVDGHGMIPLTASDADIIDFSMTPDRRVVEYTVGATREQIRRAERREYDSGILIDKTVDIGQNLYRGGSVNGRMASQRLVGYWWVRGGLLWGTPRQQHRIDLLSGADTSVGQPQPVPPFNVTQFLQPDQRADEQGDVATTESDGTKHSISVTFKDGHKLSCTDPLCASSRVSSLVWRPGSHDLVVTFKDRELRQSLYVWNVDANRLRPITAAEGLLNGGRYDFYPCAISAAYALCIASGPASPPKVEKIDLGTGTRTILFDPNSELRAAYQPKVSFLDWNIGGGVNVGAVLMRSPRPLHGSAPLFVNYYRCDGFLRGGEGNEWPIPQLLEAGYAVACINAVPLPGPQDAIRDYQVGLRAVKSLIERLSGNGLIDRSKVAMGGLSFGSEVTFWIGMNSDLLAALSVTSPEWEPANYWMSSMPGSDNPKMIRQAWGYGDPDLTPGRWRLASPAYNAHKIHSPVLFQMPEQEARRVPELYARLSRQGTPTELYAFPEEGHFKLQPRHRSAAYERNLDWFRYWLENVRDPDPTKAEQYRRWDALRSRWQQSAANAMTGAKTQGQPSH